MLLTLALGQVRGTLPAGVEAELVEELRRLPTRLGEALAMDSIVEKTAELFADKHHTLFLGRGAQYPVAMEGALKLKESPTSTLSPTRPVNSSTARWPWSTTTCQW